MNNTTKALIGCLVLAGIWVGFQSLNRPRVTAVPACDSAATGGG